MQVKIVGALVAMLALGAIACASAFAEYEGGQWAVNGVILAETITVKTKGNMKLEDSKTGTAVECKMSGERKVGPEGKGEVTAANASECKAVKVCEAGGEITVKAAHLPWKTQLELAEGTTDREAISKGGEGTPGWSFECRVLGVKTKDECTGETSDDTETVTEGVSTTFDSGSAHLSCSAGGEGTGVVTGKSVDESPPGKTLENQYIPIVATNISGGPPSEAEGAGTDKCMFTLGNQVCKTTFKNTSTIAQPGWEAKILEISLVPPEFEKRYTLEAVAKECKTGANLFGGETCAANIKTVGTIAPEWFNGYLIVVQKGNVTGSGRILLKT